MKRNVCFLLKLICFSLIFICIAFISSNVLMNKDCKDVMFQLYSAPENSVDVLILGSSHTYNAVSDIEMSYASQMSVMNLSVPGQNLPLSYYYLKEALKTQHPKVVVLDSSFIGIDESLSSMHLHMNFDNLRPSLNKISCVIDLTNPKDWINYLIPLNAYHSRWKELSEIDFKYLFAEDSYLVTSLFITEAFETPKYDYVTDGSLNEDSLIYLDKMIELAKTQGFEILTVSTPFAEEQSYQNNINTFSKEMEKRNIPFLDYNKISDELDFNYATDLANSGHVNYYGTQKISNHLGAYIKEQYQISQLNPNLDLEKFQKQYSEYMQIVYASMDSMN